MHHRPLLHQCKKSLLSFSGPKLFQMYGWSMWQRVHSCPFPQAFCHWDNLIANDDRTAVESWGGTHLPGGNIYFNKTSWDPTQKCSLSKSKVQEQKHFYEIVSFSTFTGLCSECMRNQFYSDFVSSQSNITRNQAPNKSKQNMCMVLQTNSGTIWGQHEKPPYLPLLDPLPFS